MFDSVKKRIFQILRRVFKASEEDAYDAIISEVLAANIVRVTGARHEIVIEGMKPLEFERAMTSVGKGYLRSAFYGGERPGCIILFPDAFIAACVKVRDASDNSGSVPGIMELADGMLTRLCALLPAGPGSVAVSPYYAVNSEYDPREHGGLMWLAAECPVKKVSVMGSCFYIIVDASVQDRLRADCAHAKFARELRCVISDVRAFTQQAGEAGKLADITVTNPREFVMGNVFMPSISSLNGVLLRHNVERCGMSNAAPGFSAGDRVLFKVTYEIHGSNYSVYYFLHDIGANDFERRFFDLKTFIKHILRENLLFLKSGAPGVGIRSVRYSLTAAPDTDAVVNAYCMTGRLRIKGEELLSTVMAPRSFFEVLRGAVFTANSITAPVSGRMGFHEAILSLNQALFMRGVKQYISRYAAVAAHTEIVTTYMPLYLFMEMVTDRDLAIILRNVLIPRYSRAIMGLFYREAETAALSGDSEVESRDRIIAVDYDAQRIDRLIPEEIRSADDLPAYLNASQFDALNTEAARALVNAVAGDRIVVSFRTRYILNVAYSERMRDKFRERLAELKARGVPFEKIKKLPRNRLINLLSRIGNKDLGLCVIDDRENREFVARHMSSRRREMFDEDLRYWTARFNGNDLSYEALIAAMEKVDDLADTELALERQRTRAGTRGVQ